MKLISLVVLIFASTSTSIFANSALNTTGQAVLGTLMLPSVSSQYSEAITSNDLDKAAAQNILNEIQLYRTYDFMPESLKAKFSIMESQNPKDSVEEIILKLEEISYSVLNQ